MSDKPTGARKAAEHIFRNYVYNIGYDRKRDGCNITIGEETIQVIESIISNAEEEAFLRQSMRIVNDWRRKNHCPEDKAVGKLVEEFVGVLLKQKAAWVLVYDSLSKYPMSSLAFLLEDGTRVLSGRGMQGALGLGKRHGAKLKRFLVHKSLSQFIDNDLAMALNNPSHFIRPGRGGVPAIAYEATILPVNKSMPPSQNMRRARNETSCV